MVSESAGKTYARKLRSRQGDWNGVALPLGPFEGPEWNNCTKIEYTLEQAKARRGRTGRKSPLKKRKKKSCPKGSSAVSTLNSREIQKYHQALEERIKEASGDTSKASFPQPYRLQRGPSTETQGTIGIRDSKSISSLVAKISAYGIEEADKDAEGWRNFNLSSGESSVGDLTEQSSSVKESIDEENTFAVNHDDTESTASDITDITLSDLEINPYGFKYSYSLGNELEVRHSWVDKEESLLTGNADMTTSSDSQQESSVSSFDIKGKGKMTCSSDAVSEAESSSTHCNKSIHEIEESDKLGQDTSCIRKVCSLCGQSNKFSLIFCDNCGKAFLNESPIASKEAGQSSKGKATEELCETKETRESEISDAQVNQLTSLISKMENSAARSGLLQDDEALPFKGQCTSEMKGVKFARREGDQSKEASLKTCGSSVTGWRWKSSAFKSSSRCAMFSNSKSPVTKLSGKGRKASKCSVKESEEEGGVDSSRSSKPHSTSLPSGKEKVKPFARVKEESLAVNRPNSAPLCRPSTFLMVPEDNALEMHSRYSSGKDGVQQDSGNRSRNKNGEFLTIRPVQLCLSSSALVVGKSEKKSRKGKSKVHHTEKKHIRSATSLEREDSVSQVIRATVDVRTPGPRPAIFKNCPNPNSIRAEQSHLRMHRSLSDPDLKALPGSEAWFERTKEAFVDSSRSNFNESGGTLPRNRWLTLPEEIFLNIFSHLEQTDLSRCGRSCTLFKRITSDETLWRSIDLSGKKLSHASLGDIGSKRPRQLKLAQARGLSTKGIRRLAENCGSSLKCINLSGVDGLEDSNLTPLVRSCHELNFIDISWSKVTDTGIQALVRHCPKITGLVLKGCHLITDNALSNIAKTYKTKLVHLDLFGCYNITSSKAEWLGLLCPNIQTLSLAQCARISDGCIGRLAESLKKLEIIDLKGIKQVRDSCVRKIGKYCINLKVLCLSHCSLLTDSGVAELGRYSESLVRLDLGGCINVSDSSIGLLARRLPNLQYLDISSTNITSLSIDLLAEHCLNLNTVNASYCCEITEASLKNMVRRCIRLKELYLYGCARLRNMSELLAYRGQTLILS
eukprot:Nk52_evm32s208 gene=Nk52_evmTU32s208